MTSPLHTDATIHANLNPSSTWTISVKFERETSTKSLLCTVLTDYISTKSLVYATAAKQMPPLAQSTSLSEIGKGSLRGAGVHMHIQIHIMYTYTSRDGQDMALIGPIVSRTI
jgi:hypothetical protein